MINRLHVCINQFCEKRIKKAASSTYMEQRQLLLIFIYLQEIIFVQRKSRVLCSSNYKLHHLRQTGKHNLSHYKWHGR